MMINIELLDICPKCKRVTQYYPNPMYMHKCEHCDHECGQDDLIDGFDIDQIEQALKEIASYKNHFAYVRKGRMIRKPRRVKTNA
jgi:hypothetical protein